MSGLGKRLRRQALREYARSLRKKSAGAGQGRRTVQQWAWDVKLTLAEEARRAASDPFSTSGPRHLPVADATPIPPSELTP